MFIAKFISDFQVCRETYLLKLEIPWLMLWFPGPLHDLWASKNKSFDKNDVIYSKYFQT